MKKMFRPLIIAALVGTAASAMAADTGWYIVGEIGKAKISDSQDDIDNALIGAGVTGLSSSFDDSDTSYSLLAGYQFNKNFALEGGYVDLGKENYSATFTGGTASAEAKANAWKISAVGILPINESFSVNGKLHLLYSDVTLDALATGPGGTASGSFSDRSWDTGFGVGAEYKFNEKIAVRANFDKYLKVGDSNTTGESDVKVWSVGLKYSF